MISIERGLEMVLAVAREKDRADWMPSVPVRLVDATSRVLREDILADADSPPFDKSIRDGFAVRSVDVAQSPAVLTVIGESRAGLGFEGEIAAGQCCEIMTGAPLPKGADTVVMIEYTERPSPETVRVLRAARENEGLLRQGVESRRDERLLERGRFIRVTDIGVLAATGKDRVMVSRKPRVAILATGDELVEVDQTPEKSEIRNSNTYTLYAQVERAGGEPLIFGIARDDPGDLRQKIRRALECDILLVSGGVSMGKYDFVESIFAEFGIQISFDQVAMKPGKPTVFGYGDAIYVFGLPGNPVSTLVAFEMFVRPLILFLLKANDLSPKVLEAKLDAPAKCSPERAAIVPAVVRFERGTYCISVAAWKGSSDLAGLSRANALIMIPQREGTMKAGETAHFLFME